MGPAPIQPSESGHEHLKQLPFGVALVGAVLLGSLWGCMGFISEWAFVQVGIPTRFAQAGFQVIGIISCGVAATALAIALYRNSYWRRDAAIGASLYLLLLWLTPRSFTYDTGLYHLPVITHLQQIGLEWNLGWLHSRYAFFNLPLYGQAAISRLLGTVGLPSLNGIVLTGLILFLIDQTRRQPLATVPCLMACGALLVPSEATESFHSFNADFTLGCVFLISLLLITNRPGLDSTGRKSAFTLAVLMPAIKLSGAFLLPVIATAGVARWGFRQSLREIGKLKAMIGLIAITAGLFGWITTGYLAYPVASTGPLREESITKLNVVHEAKVNTTAWARFAYSGQIKSIEADAKPMQWLPEWHKSPNGQRMLSYLTISAALAAISTRRKSWGSIWPAVLLANTIFFVVAILVLPPDPRFYLGPILLTIYALGLFLSLLIGERLVSHLRRPESFVIAGVVCLTIFTSSWRSSEFPRNQFPRAEFARTATSEETGSYSSARVVRKGKHGTCWNLPAPCMP